MLPFFLNKKLIRLSSIGQTVFRMDVWPVPIENHRIFLDNSKSLRKENAKLDDLTKSNRYFLLIDQFFKPFDLSRLLNGSQFKEWLVEFLTFCTEKYVEEIIKNTCLSLQVNFSLHILYINLLDFLFSIVWVMQFIDKGFEDTVIVGDLVNLLLLKLLSRLRWTFFHTWL